MCVVPVEIICIVLSVVVLSGDLDLFLLHFLFFNILPFFFGYVCYLGILYFWFYVEVFFYPFLPPLYFFCCVICVRCVSFFQGVLCTFIICAYFLCIPILASCSFVLVLFVAFFTPSCIFLFSHFCCMCFSMWLVLVLFVMTFLLLFSVSLDASILLMYIFRFSLALTSVS